MTKKPPARPQLPPRRSDNDKRQLGPEPDETMVARLQTDVRYEGIPKHKAHPLVFGLPPYMGQRGDETLCDEHANFDPAKMETVPELLRRGIAAGLVGKVERQGVPTMLWTVADDGWIFEARVTNSGQHLYHGYPVRSSEAISALVYERFNKWAHLNGSPADKVAAANCNALYGFD